MQIRDILSNLEKGLNAYGFVFSGDKILWKIKY